MEQEGLSEFQRRKWTDLRMILERSGPLAPSEFEPSPLILPELLQQLQILVIGAGGLGCEILKNLGLSGFRRISVIDMDEIDVSNLNRQFLFRMSDVGQSKAQVAARFINERLDGVQVTGYYAKIQDFPPEFYKQFALIICGLDSVEARRWINATIWNLYDSQDPTSCIPIIDGGTEGLKGQSRVMIPGSTSCYECSLDMITQQTKYPICTLANTPRLPEHCIEWASVLEWPRLYPDVRLDMDNPEHVQIIYEWANNRAQQFNIQGAITLSLVLGVVKNIIPAIASTNAVIAASCCIEALKMVTSCAPLLKNYMLYTGDSGVYTYTFDHQKKEECPVCGTSEISMTANGTQTLEEWLEEISARPDIAVKKPSVRTFNNHSLFMQSPPQLREQLAPNLKKPLIELLAGGQEHHVLIVTDPKLPFPMKIRLKLVF